VVQVLMPVSTGSKGHMDGVNARADVLDFVDDGRADGVAFFER
jgi:hypothetical protein